MITILLLALALVGTNSAQQQSTPRPVVHSVCAVLKQSDLYEGKEIDVESVLVASLHAAILVGKPCGKNIYISHEAGQTGGKWHQLDEVIVRKAGGLENREVKVRIRGIFHSRVPYGKATIRQIEVTEVLDISFLPKS